MAACLRVRPQVMQWHGTCSNAALHRLTKPATNRQRGDSAMAMTPDDVFKLIKDKEVKFVDLRFTDTRGKEQHVTVPVRYFGKDKFEAGGILTVGEVINASCDACHERY